MVTEIEAKEKALGVLAKMQSVPLQSMRQNSENVHSSKDSDVFSPIDLAQTYLGGYILLTAALEELFVEKLTKLFYIEDATERNVEFKNCRKQCLSKLLKTWPNLRYARQLLFLTKSV